MSASAISTNDMTVLKNQILTMLSRRPMNLMELTYGENKNAPLVERTMRELEDEGLVKKTDNGNDWRIVTK